MVGNSLFNGNKMVMKQWQTCCFIVANLLLNPIWHRGILPKISIPCNIVHDSNFDIGLKPLFPAWLNLNLELSTNTIAQSQPKLSTIEILGGGVIFTPPLCQIRLYIKYIYIYIYIWLYCKRHTSMEVIVVRGYSSSTTQRLIVQQTSQALIISSRV